MLLASGCSDEYDDSALTGRVDDLESRVEKLEELCRQMNTNISSLQTLVTALQNSDYITAVTPVTSGGQTIGYTMTFKHASPITIYHGTNGKDGQNGEDGKNGTTPVIGVGPYNGVYYWTLNGTWLTDTSGNKIKAEGTDGRDGVDGKPGQDGDDGITPELKIEDGYWWISYDNKASWTKLGQATGDKGDKGDKGDQGIPGAPGGDSIFSKVEDGSSEVIFTLADGTTTITVPKYTAAASLDIAFETTESVLVLPGKSYEIRYTLSGADERTVVEVVAQNGYRADVVSTDYQSGKIVITAPEKAADDRNIVLVSDGSDRTLMRFIHIAESVIRITTDSHIVDAREYVLEVEVETNIDYTVYIAEADREWVSVIPSTRATMRDEMLWLRVEANPYTTDRHTTVELRDASGLIVRGIQITQKALVYKSVHVAEAGTLSSYISETEKWDLLGLQVSGTLGTSDFDFIRDHMPTLKNIDLSQITNKILPSGCFRESTIQQIILPQSLEEIRDYAFYKSKLTSIEFPASVIFIEDYAFCMCSDLTGPLVFPKKLLKIDKFAFSGCSSLTGSLRIPDNVYFLGDYAFNDCPGFNGSLTLGSGCRSIPRCCFDGCSGFTGDLVIPDVVTEIGDNAFQDCTGFSGTLTIGSRVKSIGTVAFTRADGHSYALNFSKVYCKAATPPSTWGGYGEAWIIKDYYPYLGVPVGSGSSYAQLSTWNKYFTTIEEVEF